MPFLALLITLPTKATTGRMRVWRALKTLGCATLRDGVYLLPDEPEHAAALEELASAALAAEGSGAIYHLTGLDSAQDSALCELFNRAADFAALDAECLTLQAELADLEPGQARRRLHALSRRFAQCVRIDFFPGTSQYQTQTMLDALRQALERQYSPNEPNASLGAIASCTIADFQGRIWATRARPWVDRLASAWLIRRHIDPQAIIVWLTHPEDCQPSWLGFDFDGARFSHVGARVTFETLLVSFGLDANPALGQLGALIHALDIGGPRVAEAAGLEAILSGLRASMSHDDALLAASCPLFDGLFQHYQRHGESP